MEEKLRTWKDHFNISDAAHLDLQKILMDHGFSFGQLPRGPHNAHSYLRENTCPDGQIMENWPLAMTQAGCLSPPLLTTGDLQVTNVSEIGSSSTAPLKNHLQVQ